MATGLQYQTHQTHAPPTHTSTAFAAPLGPRSYRPRSARSCDFCRARKCACKITTKPPCYACQSFGRQCTFTDRPRKRKRPSVESPPPETSPVHVNNSPTQPLASSPANQTSPVTATSESSYLSNDIAGQRRTSNRSRSIPTEGNIRQDEDPGTMAIDTWPNSTAFLLGDTGESDPYLLRNFCNDTSGQISPKNMTLRRINTRDETGDETELESGRPVVFLLVDHTLYDHGEPRIEDDVLSNARSEVESMISEDVAIRLVKLCFRYIYPYFPIISRSQTISSGNSGIAAKIRSWPLSLTAALYASGLRFLIYDDVLASTLIHSPPSAQKLYRIAWLAITHEIHTHQLSTLQACLLLLQRLNDDRYVMDTAFRWSLLGWTISLAQSLGLSTDCSTWKGVPAWEKRLRRRLWWAVYVMDKWSYMSAGLSSHIKNDDFDVLPLTSADFSTSEEELVQSQSNRLQQSSHFYHLVELSVLLSDILDSYFTIGAASRTRRNFTVSLELAKPLRARLRQWKTAYEAFITTQAEAPKAKVNLDGNPSLAISFHVATILLFRALMRPLESTCSSPEDEASMETGREAVRLGAKACCAEVVELVEQLKRNTWDAFWHSWTRAGFATVSSFMFRLLITASSPKETEDVNELIVRWRWALRTGGGSSGNLLMSLALLRLDRSLLTSGIRESDDEDEGS